MVQRLTSILFIFAWLSILPTAQADEVRVGAIVPLSGEMAAHGIEIRRALELALREREERGLQHQYKLIFEDNQLSGQKSASAAQKLISSDRVDAIITLWPPTALVVAPLTERSGTLHYTIAWDPSLAQKHKLLLSHQVMVDEIARRTLRLMYENGTPKIAFLHMQETGFDLGAEKVRSLANSECVELVADESFAPSESDFRSLVARILRKRPDAIVIWAVMPSIDLLIRQLRAQHPTIPISGYLDYAEDLRPLQGSRYISEMYASTDFEERYLKHFGSAPRSKGPNAFDIMNLLIDAYESLPLRKPAPGEARAFVIRQKDIAGAVGEFSVQPDGNSSYSPVVRRVNNTERQLTAERLEENNCLERTADRRRSG